LLFTKVTFLINLKLRIPNTILSLNEAFYKQFTFLFTSFCDFLVKIANTKIEHLISLFLECLISCATYIQSKLAYLFGCLCRSKRSRGNSQNDCNFIHIWTKGWFNFDSDLCTCTVNDNIRICYWFLPWFQVSYNRLSIALKNVHEKITYHFSTFQPFGLPWAKKKSNNINQ